MNFDTHEKIDRFLQGNMSEAESSSFLNQVEHNSALQEMLETDRIISTSLSRDKSALATHDLSKTATVFVAALATSSAATPASASVVSAGIVKSSSTSLFSILTSTILSVIICSAGYYFIHEDSSSSNQSSNIIDSKVIENRQSKSLLTIKTPKEVAYTTPKPINQLQKKRVLKVTSKSQIDITTNSTTTNTDVVIQKHKKLLEHSSSRYRIQKID